MSSSPSSGEEADEPAAVTVNFQTHRANTKGGRVTKIKLDQAHQSVIGSGSFAKVYLARYKRRGKTETVALKESTSNRMTLEEEISLLRKLDHPNVIGMKFSFRNAAGKWYVGMELVDGGDLYHFIRDNFAPGGVGGRRGLGILCEVFGYQIFRGLAYLHSKNIVHRDLKPENCLVTGDTGELKLIDFGCSKKLESGKRDTFRVGTKEFRAPELLLHSTLSTPPLDAWGAGVIMTEMGLGKPVFGEGPEDDWNQFLRVASFLGKPTKKEEDDMGASPEGRRRRSSFLPFGGSKCCKKKAEGDRASVPGHSTRDLGARLSQASVHDVEAFADLCSLILVYSPTERLHCWDACAHPFFGRLRDKDAKLPSGKPVPDLSDFSAEEVENMPERARKVLVRS